MRRTIPTLCALLVLAACSDAAPTRPAERAVCAGPSAAAAAAFDLQEPLDAHFAEAGRDFDVPPALLAAIGYVETRWRMVEGRPEHGRPAAYGLMALRGDRLERGAALAGVAPLEARTRPAANIRAAAALLGDWAREAEIRRDDLGAWAPVVARYSGIELPAGRSAYVHDDVFAILRRGASVRGVASIAPTPTPLDFPRFSRSAAAAPDFPAAVWRPSPNYNRRPAGERIAIVVIHSCEGAYTGCWSWLANPASGVSAHYVVREDGSEITQLVGESDRAWHIAARYDCSLNGGVDCHRNGQQSNDFTIGIEHGGYAAQTSWPAEQIDASARLVCDATRRQGIPRDRVHIVSHARLQPYNRTDPGANWPWDDYLARIDRYCAGGGAVPRDTLLVDSDNAGPGRDRGYLSLSAAWTPASATPGFLGSGYHFAPTSTAVADPATFHFFLPTAASRTVEARWTAGGNRSPEAIFQITTSDGRELARVSADQQRGGGVWHRLGSWTFPAGWNQVHLSRLGPAGCVVIADAVRVTE